MMKPNACWWCWVLAVASVVSPHAHGGIDVTAPSMVQPAELVVVQLNPTDRQTGTWLPIEPRSLEYRLFEQGNVVVFSSGPLAGTITLLVTVVEVRDSGDLPRVSVEQQWVDIVVRPDGPDKPPPTPDIPEDPFGDIGRRTNQWATEVLGTAARNLAVRVAGSYSGVAAELESGAIKSVADAAKQVSSRNKVIWGADSKVADQYAALGRRIGDVWSESWPLTSKQVVAFFRAVAAGLEVVR